MAVDAILDRSSGNLAIRKILMAVTICPPDYLSLDKT
jgi:hypothetical protein